MKWVYYFTEGNLEMKELLGGKGANLAEMKRIGIPVPPVFTITTETCDFFSKNNSWPEELEEQIKENITKIENDVGSIFGSLDNPLLLSVRSGAAASMPGMMDTVLNLGLNDKTVLALAKKSNNEQFAYDSYRRFIQMFGEVDMGVSSNFFESALEKIKEKNNVFLDNQLSSENLKELILEYKEIIRKETGKEFPQDPFEQLRLSINAVFKSWNNKRAKEYRKLNNIEGLLGTAVNVQAMVFGNMGQNSGTGVCFSRNPSTGENKFYGEYLINAQGEDVVAGIRTPEDIKTLENVMPEQYNQLVSIYKKLESHFKDMQDMEFTIQDGKLYMLQTRNGKRTGKAAVEIAMDMLKEGLIDEKEALLRVNPFSLDQLLHKSLDLEDLKDSKILTTGLPASPGAVSGEIVFDSQKAFDEAEKGKKVILVRIETSPEDITGMNACQGILTQRGGMTSHAAVVARGMGKPCVSACSNISIFEEQKKLIIDNLTLKEGEVITIDGSSGRVYNGVIKTSDPKLSGSFKELMDLSDKYRKLKIRTNADTVKDSKKALYFGAQGIGLCRTEHMFFESDRIKAVREMILSETLENREKALSKLLPMQRNDFIGLFEIMEDRPVTIRLLDPPLHEFLPKEKQDIIDLSLELNVSLENLEEKINSLHEFNPMLGHRGCRLGITYPEITEMQTRAIIEAVIIASEKINKEIIPEIMIPLVGNVEELRLQKEIIDNTACQVMKEKEKTIKYKVGTMIEVPRAALTADDISQYTDFFSFGTNDLTQMTLGVSRDDSSKFLKEYVDKKIYKRDPFQSIDVTGVGKLMEIAISKGKDKKPNLKLGICGEHGGDPESIFFCHNLCLDYVSCSPFRVPIARLAAAHAAILEK